MSWIAAHVSLIVSIAGALWTLLSIINGAIQAPRAKVWIGHVLDLLSYIKRAGADGSVKLPFTRSFPKYPTAGEIIAARSATGLVVAFALFAMGLSACATTWGKAFVATEKACQVAAIPAEKQAALEAVEAALADPLNWEAELIELAKKEGTEQVNCLVMAVRAAKSGPSDGGVLLASDVLTGRKVRNADAWLARHSRGAR